MDAMDAEALARRLPIVVVLGSGTEAHEELSLPLGAALAGMGVHLLTGGGGGVMGAVSEAFAREPDREGLVLAVLPGDASGASPTGYPNPWVELPIRTHLPLSGEQGTDALSRNHLNVLTADVLVALPGSAGTRSEIELALRYARPIVRHARDEGVEGVQTLPDLEDVLAFVREHASS
jgi:uncharacterized protein (TIGR00725 family)